MTEQENEKIVRGLYEAYLSHDLKIVLDACSEDTQWLAVGPPDRLPYAGLHSGPQGVEKYFAILDDAEESDHLIPQEFIAHEDRVIVFGEYIARVNSTGVQFKTDFVHVFTLLDGKITKFRDFYDTFAAVKAYHGDQSLDN